MDSLPARFKKVSQSKDILNKIFHNKSLHFLIHYSCESFVDHADRSHKVTSIAVRNLQTAQTESYSIFQYAEKLHIPSVDITARYDEIEKRMLNDFFNFLERHANYHFIHWNMRDINYGFKAIEHRGEVLECNVFKLSDNNKIDLPRVLKLRYSKNYIGHPRLELLIDLNKITKLDFLTGQQEALAFTSGQFVQLHLSTLRKIDSFESIISRIEDNELKVQSTFFEIYGLSWKSIIKGFKEHWIISLISLIGIISATIIKVITLINGF